MSHNRNIETLKNHLFAQIERIGNEDLEGESLKEEIRRGKAISELSGSVIEAAKTEFAYLDKVGGLDNSSFVDDSAHPGRLPAGASAGKAP